MKLEGSFSYQGTVQTDRRQPQVPQDLGQFTGSLSAAQSQLDWLSSQDLALPKTADSVELIKEHKSKKELSDERAEASLVSGMVNQQKVGQTQSAKSWSNSSVLEQNGQKQMTNRQAEFRFQKSAEQLQGDRASEMLNQKIMERKGHLFNPALAQTAQGDTETYAKLTEAKPAANKAEEPANVFSKSAQTEPKIDSEAAKARQQFQQFGEVRNSTAKPNRAFVPENKASSGIQALNQAAQARATALTASKGMLTKAASAGDSPGVTFAALTKEKPNRLEEKGQAQAAKPKPTTQAKLKEVADNVKMMINAKRGELTMQLNPAHLGKLEIKLTKLEDGYKGKMKVDSIEAKEVLERQLPELKETLAAQGLKIEEFTLEVRDQGAQATFADAGDQRSGNRAFEQGTQPAFNANKARSFEPQMTQSIPLGAPANRVSADQVSIYA